MWVINKLLKKKWSLLNLQHKLCTDDQLKVSLVTRVSESHGFHHSDIWLYTYYSAISLYSVKSCPCPLDPLLGILFCLCLISDAIASCVSGLGIGGSWRRPSFGNGLETKVDSFTGKLSSDLESEEEDACKREKS